MFDPKAPSSILAVTELKKPGVMSYLRSIAVRRTGQEADAKDLVVDSLVRVLDPDDVPWRPGGHTFRVHMSSIMRQVWYRQRRRLSVGAEVPDGGDAQENAANDGLLEDEELDRKRSFETERMLGDRVLARLAGDVPARKLFELAKHQDLELSEEAAILQCTVGEIRAIRKRLAYHARIVLDEWTSSEERRMGALREHATKGSEEGTP